MILTQSSFAATQVVISPTQGFSSPTSVYLLHTYLLRSRNKGSGGTKRGSKLKRGEESAGKGGNGRVFPPRFLGGVSRLRESSLSLRGGKVREEEKKEEPLPLFPFPSAVHSSLS